MKRLLIFLASISMVELSPANLTDFNAMSKMIDPVSLAASTMAWDCACDKACDMGEQIITPFIESFHGGGKSIPGAGIWNWFKEKASGVTAIVNNGFDLLKSKVNEFGGDVTNSIGVLVTEGTQQVKQYYDDVLLHHNQSNPLQLFCDKTRSLGLCKCFLKRVAEKLSAFTSSSDS
ncbi:uncharacterized protein LOC135844096 [Planococcus citri]|uniref:uncharacterized protein LOC135844096 n=1 Tax=Planococcus citri TaxID=170843 RepID=UPI0031F80679